MIMSITVYGYQVPEWALYAAGAAFVLACLAIGYLWYREKRRVAEAVADVTDQIEADAKRELETTVEEVGNDLDDDHQRAQLEAAVTDVTEGIEGDGDPGAGYAGQLDPPNVGSSLSGLISAWRHRVKQKRLARKGYIKWYKVGARMAQPQWVKPDLDGSGEPEYYDKGDDVTYLFPEEAMVTDSVSGAYVAYHRRNEVEPINMRDPGMPVLDADRLEEVINMEAESEAPGLFDRLNIDQGTLVMLAIGGLFLVFAAYRYMG